MPATLRSVRPIGNTAVASARATHLCPNRTGCCIGTTKPARGCGRRSVNQPCDATGALLRLSLSAEAFGDEPAEINRPFVLVMAAEFQKIGPREKPGIV